MDIKYLLICALLCLNPNCLNAQINVDSCIANWQGVDYQPPQVFQNMLNAVPSDTFYISVNDPDANDTLNGQYPVYMGGYDGPFRTFKGLGTLNNTSDSIGPGDMIMIREGIYLIDSLFDSTVNINYFGTEQAPIFLKNFPGENPIIEGTFDSIWFDSLVQNNDTATLLNYFAEWNNKPTMLFSGEYLIVDGLKFQKSHSSCTVNKGKYFILQNCFFNGSLEDQIKTTNNSYYSLIYNNEFTGFAGEAIDVFGAQNYYVVNNYFHHQYLGENPRSGVSVAWAKGGADSVYFVNNRIEELEVTSNALVLGGCCWNNWNNSPDSLGNLQPVGTHVYAWGNLFNNISIDSSNTPNFQGVLSFQASRYTSAANNLFHQSEPLVPVINASDPNGQSLVADHLSFYNNIISDPYELRLYNLAASYDPQTTYIDSNCVYNDANVDCNIGGVGSMSYTDFKANLNYDINGCEGNYEQTCDAVQEIDISVFNANINFIIYPNPSNSYVCVDAFKYSNDQIISLYNMAGKLLFSSADKCLDINSIKNGIYLLKVEQGLQKEVFKVVKN